MINHFRAILIFSCILLLAGCGKKPVACFVVPDETLEAGVEYVYEDCSVEAEQYLWEFGDGNTSDSSTGKHTFENAGAYTMVLTVKKDDKEDRVVRTVRIESIDRTGLSVGRYTGTFWESYPTAPINNKTYTQTMTVEAIDNNNVFISTVRGGFHATVSGTSTEYSFTQIRRQTARLANMSDGTGSFDATGFEEYEFTLQGTDPVLGDIPWILSFRGSRN